MPPSDESRQSAEVVVYRPDNSLRRGYFSLWGDIVRELVRNRWLTVQLVKRDVGAFYKQSLLGIVWVVLIPLITVGTFVLLRSSGVVAVGTMSAPYPIFAVLGVAVWQLFAQGLVAGASSLAMGGDMLTRINFSKKSLVIAAMGRTIVSFAVLVVLVAACFVFYGFRGYDYTPTLGLALAPLSLIPLLLLTLGLAFYLALLNSIVRDIATMLSVLVTFLMLLTPVLYERPVVSNDAGGIASALSAITEYNPLYYLVSAPRELVLSGQVADVGGYLIASGFSLGVFLVAIFGFHLTETRIAERV